ncbi:MAG: hypothetical protein K0S61_2709, partial [Anaerocolumna sp.]|nr:hypothetical protein [Anaerocolumna sp.]
TEVRQYLLKELPEYMIPSYFVKIDRIPLTVNGKVDKNALPEPDTSITDEIVYEEARDYTEKILIDVWRDVLGVDKLGIDNNFFEVGGDSIKAIQVSARVQKYNMKLDVKDILQYPVIRQLSRCIKVLNSKINQDLVQGEVEFTPVQRWFFENKFKDMHYFNQSIMLFTHKELSKEIFVEVFDKILEHHDALRMVYKVQGEDYIQYNRKIEEKLYNLNTYDLSDEKNIKDIIDKKVSEIHKNLDINNGPIVGIGVFKEIQGTHIFIAIHHLVVDGVSWRILIEDIKTALEQAMNKKPLDLQDKTNSFMEWAKRLNEYSKSSEVLSELEYWKNINKKTIIGIPRDYDFSQHISIHSEEVSIELSKVDTDRLLMNCNKAYNTEINDILLTTLGITIKQWIGNDNVLINLEGHGREQIIKDIDISRTVGWFTSIYPIILEMNQVENIGESIKKVKEMLRNIPNKGIGYGILKYLGSEDVKKCLVSDIYPEISFNYLGQFDHNSQGNILEASPYSKGKEISNNYVNRCLIDINGSIENGQLSLQFTYSNRQYRRETISNVAKRFKENLMKIINHCAEKDMAELTPSDCSSKEIDFDIIENVLSMLDEI